MNTSKPQQKPSGDGKLAAPTGDRYGGIDMYEMEKMINALIDGERYTHTAMLYTDPAHVCLYSHERMVLVWLKNKTRKKAMVYYHGFGGNTVVAQMCNAAVKTLKAYGYTVEIIR